MPKVDVKELQRVVFKLEMGKSFDNFDALCEATSETVWAKDLGLSASAIARLIVTNSTITKVAKPDKIEEPVKRGRGRPRKTDTVEVKRGPGRPPKTSTPKTTPVKAKSEPEQVRTFGSRVVSIPAGRPPVNLKDLDRSSVEEWVENVRSHGRSKGITYLPSAIVYWLRYFCDINGDDYRQAKRVIVQMHQRPSDEGDNNECEGDS